MTDLTRAQALNYLEDGWGTYVNRYQKLGAEAQAAFLKKQGYARLGDLLGHIVAWWDEARLAIPLLASDPDFRGPDYNVDAFNAAAVERFSDCDEASMIRTFDATRTALIDLVNELPEEAFRKPAVTDRISMEIIGHLGEHAIG
jgi:hypothetical protein